MNPKTDFMIYLTSLGSRRYFPQNDNSTFSNVLHQSLTGMSKYEVALVACCIPAPVPTTTLLLCSEIVSLSVFDEREMPVLGIYSASTPNVPPTYMPLATDNISIITCCITDITGKKFPLSMAPLLALHFRQRS